jgi:basic membrane lipoprotein Med (substrate-binding protein (PBP1-ABC) superfamily)
MIKKNKSGKLGGETYVAELKNGGLKIVYNPSFKLPEAVKKAGDKAIQDITSGTIKIKP